MKLKKLIVIFLLAVLFVVQFSWLHVDAAGSGTVPQNKSVVVSAKKGDKIEGANREEGNIVTFTERVSNASFDVAMERVTETAIHSGDEVELNVKIHNLKNLGEGLIALMGQLEYDKNVLENLTIEESTDGWEIGNNGFNENNLKFVIDNGKYINKDSSIFKIKFRVKENVTDGINSVQTLVKVKNIVASDGENDISTNHAELSVEIQPIPTELTSDVYTVEEGLVSRIPAGTTVAIFKTNVKTNQALVIKDKAGNVLGEDAVLATGMTLEVGKTKQYTLIVTADIDENGEVTVTDLAKLKLHLIEKELLTGNALKAADIKNDNQITITDLAQLKLMLIK